jgi:tRNA modification GTPase
MRFNLNDTIAAPATPAGSSALAVIRVSGSESVSLVSDIFSERDKLLQAEGYQAVYGFIRNSEEIIDEVICLVLRNPHSYTGEDMVEISGHGNPDLTNRIMQLLYRSCRPAEPGEFTFRAFMNHKLDLAQAEAVNDLIQARTSKAETAALNQLKGKLSEEVASLVTELSDCRLKFELSIDFADQDLPELDLEEVRKRLDAVFVKLQALVENGKQGRILRDGFTVCLSGAPNVGKSSVFNKFLEENRALVTPIPGTTRDYLQEWLSLDGYPVKLIDTAGLRETRSKIEKLGIDRTKELIAKADLVVTLTDPDTLKGECQILSDNGKTQNLCVLNKVDLLGFDKLPDGTDWHKYLKGSRFKLESASAGHLIPCSANLADGIATLRQQIISRISLPDLQPSSVLVTNTRHLAALEKAVESLSKALEGIANQAGYEFIAFDIIESVSHLSEITGAITTDEMLEKIFSSFCIGK